MRGRFLVGTVLATCVAAVFVVACGDDDGGTATPGTEAGPTPNPGTDAGPTPGTDAAPTPDAGTDSAVALPPITPLTTARLPNAINPYGMTVASDGMLYASGATVDEGTRKLAVWRFKDGAPDATFGNAGVLFVDIPGDETSYAMAEVSPGNFVIHAISDGKVFLTKLTKSAGGTFSFGTPTFVKFGWDEGEGWPAEMVDPPASPPSINASYGFALDKTGAQPKLVLSASGAPAKAVDPATQRGDNDRWIVRLMADTFAVDPAFNGGKAYTVDVDGKKLGDNARRPIVEPDGAIVAAGYTDFGAGLGNHIVLIRLLSNGTVDQGFGFGTTPPGAPGQAKYNPFVSGGGYAESYGVARTSAGLYVTAGYGTSNANAPSKAPDMVATRVKKDGLDTTFGKLGVLAVQSELDKSAGLGTGVGATAYDERGRDVICLADDRCIVAGAYDGFATLYVIDKNGKLDVGSGSGGMLEYAYPGNMFRIVAAPDGKTLFATATSITQVAGQPQSSLLVTLEVGQ